MNQLIVVSNRTADPGKPAPAGGLAVALQEGLANRGGIWVGWSGRINAAEAIEDTLYAGIRYVRMDLSSEAYDKFYSGFCNTTLWPLCHDRPSLLEYSRDQFTEYRRVNRALAEILARTAKPDDLIWVHDYHLMMLAVELRRLGLRNPIGFFLHVPFPQPGLLAQLPCDKVLAEGLCAFDLFGFQTEDDQRGCLDYFRRYCNAEIDGDRVRAFGRVLRTGVFPIGIETAKLVRQARTATQTGEAARLRDSLHERALILGIDRLDYSKGILQRFAGFEAFLQRWPEFRKKVVLTQICPPSREGVKQYRLLRRELEGKAGHINSRFADVDWTPIRYVSRSYGRRSLAGFYRTARVALVTPFRDGMNLVAKEFVACQNPDDPGVLVLSRFAGAARQLDRALLVNPFDPEEIAEALQAGLTMSLEERQERWRAMMEVLTHSDIDHWRESFLTDLAAAASAPASCHAVE